MSRAPYDYVVIGGGAAGLVAAGIAATLGARTALIERAQLGGDCTWRGCIPSKTLLRAARAAHAVREAGRFGIDVGSFAVDLAAVRARLDAVRAHIYAQADAPEAIARRGVEVLAGTARFADGRSLLFTPSSGSSRIIRARRFCIASGSRPRTLEAATWALTTETIFDVPAFPARLAIVGGGPVSVELGQAFARLGVAVTLVVRGRRLLRRDDPGHAERISAVLAAEGVALRFGTTVAEATRADGTVRLRLHDGEILEIDDLLVATGREPETNRLGLAAAGVRVHDGAIAVDDRMRTTNPRIDAIGDCTGPPYFTHAAEEAAKVAVTSGLLRLPARFEVRKIPWCTFTDPELARVGESAEELTARGASFSTLRFDYDELDRAIVDGATTGEAKLSVGRGGKLLGASILGARAGETAGELALAYAAGLSARTISGVVHPYPTYAYGARRAADGALEATLTPTVRRLLGLVYRFRGA